MENSFSKKKTEKGDYSGKPILTKIFHSKKSSHPKVYVIVHPVKNTHAEHHIMFFRSFRICTSQPVITITLLLQLQWTCGF